MCGPFSRTGQGPGLLGSGKRGLAGDKFVGVGQFLVIGYDLFRTGCYRFGVVVTFEVDDVQGLLQFGHLARGLLPGV